MHTMKVIYQTTIHLALFAMLYLYFGSTYTLARVEDLPRNVEQADEYTSMLDSHLKHKASVWDAIEGKRR